MKIKYKAIAGLVMVAASAFMMGSCTPGEDSSGFEYMPDMYRSPAIEPYVDYGEVKGMEDMSKKMKISALVPPAYTIPFYGTDSSEVALMLPYHRLASKPFKATHGMYGVDLSDANEYELAVSDKNPLSLTEENSAAMFKEGKALFAANCAHCHGEKGDGNGPMVLSGVYAGVPDYKNLTISEGQMFYSIYYGKGSMGAHNSIVNKKEIWTLVHYVRKFQDAKYGDFSAPEVEVTATDSVNLENK
jgi:mono/diheme cytochrome c family protein